MRRFRFTPWIAGVIAGLLALALTACGGSQKPAHKPAPRLLAVYAGGEPGTDYANQALQWAKAAGFDVVINYSSINAQPGQIAAYLAQADKLHLKVVLSLKDLLGKQDLDQTPDNRAMHQQFGPTTHDEVTGIVSQFGSLPAVWGFSISDELPGNASELNQWLPQLKERQAQIKQISHKPTLVTLYWSGNDPSFYRTVSQTASDFALDYYPYPENSTYGPVNTIKDIGHTLQTVAGTHSWYVLQAFGWGNGQHDVAKQLGFKATDPAPDTDHMVAMAKMAVTSGAYNLTFFSYDDNVAQGDGSSSGNPQQLANIKAAVAKIRAANWWHNQ